MTDSLARVQRNLKTAAYLLIAGLLLEGFTLYWADPTSFLLFICVSGTLIGLGILIYLIAIVTT
jgi:polyferredoxin